MKKSVITLSLMAFIAGALCGCGDKAEARKTYDTTTEEINETYEDEPEAEETDEIYMAESDNEVDEAEAEEIRNRNEPAEDFVFHFTGKLNQSYIMENSHGEPVYEAVCDGVTLVKDTKFEFKNHITGASETKMISHTVSHSYGSNGFGMTISSAFNIDGKNCWDVLADMGYGFDFGLNGVKAHYEVKHMGVNIGYAELGGTGLVKEKYENNPLGKLPTNGIFKVSCPRSEVEGMFLVCFCLSKTDTTIN